MHLIAEQCAQKSAKNRQINVEFTQRMDEFASGHVYRVSQKQYTLENKVLI
jgi:hypothetical protein